MGTPEELDRWWWKHASGADWLALESALQALRGRSTRRQRWAHSTQELSVLAHAWLVLREPVRWHGGLELRERLGTVRRVALLVVDAVPAAVTAPSERTTTVPVLDETEHWTHEQRTMHREWRVGRWGWWDPVRNKWYPSLALSGGATITAAAGGGNYSVGGSWVGGSAPDSTSDVLLTASSGSITVNLTTNAARSLDCTGYLNTLTFGTGNTLSVGDASGGAVKFAATMAITDGIGTLALVSTSNNGGTGWALTTAGLTLPSVTVNGVGGKFVLQDNATFGAQLLVTNGGFFGNGKTIGVGQVSSSNGNVRTIDITNCVLTLPGQTGWSSNNSSGLTFTSTGSSITFTNPAVSNTMGTLSFNTVIFSGFTSMGTFTGAASFVNLTITGAAQKTSTFQLANSITVTSTLALNSNAAVNRLLLFSNTRGTQRSIAMAGGAVVIDNTAAASGSSVDFMDIAITGTPSWTANHSTLVGNARGNGGAVTTNVTAPVTQTHTASAGGSWSDVTKWTSRVPLPQDDVVVDGNTTGTLTVDMPRLGASLDFSAYTAAISWAACELYGSFTHQAASTGNSNVVTITFAGRGSHTTTLNGRTPPQVFTVNGPGGTYQLQDTFQTQVAAPTAFTVAAGTVDINGRTLGIANMVINNALATITGTGTINLAITTTSNCWNLTAGSCTFTGTIALSTASANTRTFAGGGKTYGTLTYTVAGSTGQLVISGSNTWAGNWNLSDATNARAIGITNGTTQTFTSTGAFFNVTGSSGKLTTFTSTSAGSAYTFTKTSGSAVFVNFVSLKDSTATGGLWVDGPNYTSVSGNTGWVFADAVPSGAETSTGADTSGSTAFSSADALTGVDDGTLSVAATSAETGADAETDSTSAATSNAESSSGADAASALSVSVSSLELSSGAESGSNAASTNATEVGTDVEVAVIAAALNNFETSTANDAALPAGATLLSSDVGAAIELESTASTFTSAELSSSSEVGLISAQLLAQEVGTAVDAQLASAATSSVELSSASDAGTLAAQPQSSEQGSSTDAGTAVTFSSSSEQGQSVDVGVVAALLSAAEAIVAAEFELIIATQQSDDSGLGLDDGVVVPLVPPPVLCPPFYGEVGSSRTRGELEPSATDGEVGPSKTSAVLECETSDA